MHMNVASAECKYLIYHFNIIIYKKNPFTQIASVYDLKAFQIKCCLISFK